MVWDATKSPGDLITSSDWNSMVSDQKGHASRHADGGTDALGSDSITSTQVDESDNFVWSGNHTFNNALDKPQDSGASTLANMSVSSTPSQGTEQSIGIDIDGTRIFKAYAEADGAGGIQDTALDMSTNKIQNVGLIDGVDITSHASRHKDGGSDELDAAELAGGLGTSGQVLQTDGSSASWTTFSSGASVSDDGTQVLASPDDVNYGSNLDVTDDGDGSVTVDASGGSTQTVDSDKTLQQVIRFGAEGSSTTSSSYVSIEESDIALDFDDFEDNNVYVKFEAHLENDRDYFQDINIESITPDSGSSKPIYVESENQYWAFDSDNNQVIKMDETFTQQSTASYTHSFPQGLAYRPDVDRIYHMNGETVTELDKSLNELNTYDVSSSSTYQYYGIAWDRENSRFVLGDFQSYSSSEMRFDEFDTSFSLQNNIFSWTYGSFDLNRESSCIFVRNNRVYHQLGENNIRLLDLNGNTLYSSGAINDSTNYSVLGADDRLYVYNSFNDPPLGLWGEQTRARVFRQNDGTSVSNTEVIGRPIFGKDWVFKETGWIDVTAESGKESYQLQLRRKGSNSTPTYNSVLMKIATN